jgi:hypothetical protein
MLGPTPVSAALGKLVEREVASYRRRTALDPDGIRDAVDDARTVADELARLIARLERTAAPEVRRVSHDAATEACVQALAGLPLVAAVAISPSGIAVAIEDEDEKLRRPPSQSSC